MMNVAENSLERDILKVGGVIGLDWIGQIILDSRLRRHLAKLPEPVILLIITFFFFFGSSCLLSIQAD